MIELSEPIQRALDAGRGEPLHVVDPRDQQTYVLVPSFLYERWRTALQDGLDMNQVAQLVAQGMGDDDADDPLLDSYQKYRRP